ncbi:MAG: hypothetical protein H0U84_06870 [Thermoleophilaceae bacterium]|nr:hypothetical protein [Thermoleophilaceae bacterium]
MRKHRLVTLAVTAVAVVMTGCTLNRPEDPVVLTGANVPSLSSVAAGDVVAFRWINRWLQVPVQVDERKQVDFGTLYNSSSMGFATTVYADANTFAGADTNANVDADDEIAFMAKDTGSEAPGGSGNPAGVVAGSGVKVRVRSNLNGTADGWIYLFKRSGTLSPGAGQKYVDYAFNLLSGNYKTTYRLQDGPNPENSTVSSPYYSTHFADRWLKDELRIKTGNATEVDILDRAKALFAPGVCVRSENTFNDAEGAFIVNKSGPVRALRSYIGANSGPLTQREHVFYERREDVRTFLRVHAIPGVMDFHDYSAAAGGMTYKSNPAPGGVTVDGVPDSPAAGQLSWESLDGPQGGLTIAHSTSTDVPSFTSTSYYFDDSTPGTGAETQCTGDNQSFGASGPWINRSIPNTDPRDTPFNRLLATRTLYFDAPSTANGAARSAQATSPFAITATSYP